MSAWPASPVAKACARCPPAGTDVVVFNDMNPFDNTGMANAKQRSHGAESAERHDGRGAERQHDRVDGLRTQFEVWRHRGVRRRVELDDDLHHDGGRTDRSARLFDGAEALPRSIRV